MNTFNHGSGVAATGRARWRGWRTPPNWSPSDWRQEASAEAVAAACEALRDYDAARGIPLHPFVEGRAIAGVLTRYRREWRYALRTVPFLIEWEDAMPLSAADEPPVLEALRCAISELPLVDQRLLHALFWEGRHEAEVAADLGISQQAVSKRKHHAIEALRTWLKGDQRSFSRSEETVVGRL